MNLPKSGYGPIKKFWSSKPIRN